MSAGEKGNARSIEEEVRPGAQQALGVDGAGAIPPAWRIETVDPVVGPEFETSQRKRNSDRPGAAGRAIAGGYRGVDV